MLDDGTVDWRHNYAGLKWRDGRCAISNEWFSEGTSEQEADGSRTNIVAKFYRFNSLEECVIGYFQFTNIAHYSNLKGVTDPRTYLENIKKDNYATSHDYVENCMAVIEKWNLTQYDDVKEETKMPVKVCIDAGHYGRYNRCPNNPAYYESDMAWKLHLLQKKYLEALGVEVITTRASKNKDLSLNARGRAAQGCDLFISDHSNAVGNGMNESIDYVATYHLVDDATVKCDDISKDIAAKIAPIIAGVMGTKQGYRVVSRKSGNDRNGDGVMNDNYYGVLHGARSVNVPGLILEHSFHTNSAAVAWLLKDENLDKLARSEAEFIASYLIGKEVHLDADENEDKGEVKGESNTLPAVPFSVRVIVPDLNYRSEPSMKGEVRGQTGVGTFTIVEVKNGWGKLKSGAGWIYLENPEYCTILQSKTEVKPEESKLPYMVRVSITDLNVRTGPGTNYTVVQQCPVGSFTIVEEKEGEGATKWGRLKSGAGWISLDFVEKI